MRWMQAHLAVLFPLLAAASLSLDNGAHASPPEPSMSGAGGDRPNIVFIMADDHGVSAVSSYNEQSMIQTPHIDRLAREGIRFDAAYANNSICSPSRASLLTGQYNHACGVKNVNEIFDESLPTFPQQLQKAGYQTGLFGKWHLRSTPQGFDRYEVMEMQGDYRNPLFKTNTGDRKQEGYTTDLITDNALQWLDRRDTDRPFCIMIHHKAPHGPHVPAVRHRHLFSDTDLPLPDNLFDDFEGRAPAAFLQTNHRSFRKGKIKYSRILDTNYAQYRRLWNECTGDVEHDTTVMYQGFMKGYLRLVASLDENVGRVLDYLEANGLLKNTMVVYTSDNGFFVGEHGFYNKMWMYEEGYQLPFIVRMPDEMKARPAGSVSREFISMIDVAPTFLALAGAEDLEAMHGESFLPLLTDENATGRETLYYRFYGSAAVQMIGLRAKTDKLIYYPEIRFWEYFDLARDPAEMRNGYQGEGNRERIETLKKQLVQRANGYGDQDTVAILEEAGCCL